MGVSAIPARPVLDLSLVPQPQKQWCNDVLLRMQESPLPPAAPSKTRAPAVFSPLAPPAACCAGSAPAEAGRHVFVDLAQTPLSACRKPAATRWPLREITLGLLTAFIFALVLAICGLAAPTIRA